MPCENAMFTNVITISPDQTVEQALELLEEKHIRSAPVVGSDNKLKGVFSLNVLLKNLLPISVTMEDGLQRLDFVIGAAPGISKRLRKLKPQKVETAMDDKTVVLHPDTPAWEAIRLLVKYGSPLPVVNEETGEFYGLISEQSMLTEMSKSPEELEALLKE